MPSPADRGARVRTDYAVVEEKTLVRRPTGWLLWVAVVLLPVALTAYVGMSRGPSLQRALRADVSQALRDEGLTGVRVSVDGRQVVARVPIGSDAVEVAEVAASVPGVMAVSTRAVFASRSQARACRGVVKAMNTATHQQQIPFAGASASLTGVGQERVRAAARVLTRCRAVTAIIGGHTDSSVADPGTLSLERARVLLRALVEAGVPARRLEPRGYGDAFKLREGSTDADRAANQRGSVLVEGP
jgi:outer membrane protein OmpA-like peptidoglycan-associated protein